jgi:hypothetical protein
MSKATLPVPTFSSGEAYTPRFELWMNGIIWQAIYNVVNSFSMQEMHSFTIPGMGLTSGTKVPTDIFIERVKILRDTVLAVQREDSFYQEDMKEIAKQKDRVEEAHIIYQAMLRLLHRSGHLRFKPPRDFADD